MTALKDIENRLAREIGLNAASVGVASIRLCIKARMKTRGIKEPDVYAALLAESETEVQRLIEAVVVPETWFFRDHQPFVALGDWVVNRWLPAHPQGVLRVLSMPCSTGEEPYSIVMTLLDAGVPSSRFAVEAVDISNLSLQRARSACYGNNAFRGRSIEFRSRYFEEIEPGLWRLNDSIRKQVQFRQTNLLNPDFATSTSSKDVIFCRNLLIYLDTEGQQKVIKTAETLLSPGGMIFAGHAEAYLYSRSGFQPSPYPMAFAFQRRSISKPASQAFPVLVADGLLVPRKSWRMDDPLKPSKLEAPPPPAISSLSAAPPRPTVRSEPQAPRPPALLKADASLDECQRLADRGELEATIKKTEAHLETYGPSARAFYLLALAKDALGKLEEASQLYRKTLYLEPDHSEAIAHLALLAKNSGDTRLARQLQERLRRLETRKPGDGKN